MMAQATPLRLIGGVTIALCLFSIVAFLIGGEAVTAWTQAQLARPDSRTAIGVLLFLLLAGDIVLPVPSSLAATGAGMMFGAVGGTLIAGLGMAAGAMAGLVGARRLGRDRVAASMGAAEFARLETMLGRYAPIVVMLCRPVPVLAETTVLVAGACGASPGRLFLPITLSSLGMAGVYAWLGAAAGGEVSFLVVFAASCILPSAAWLAAKGAMRLMKSEGVDS